MWPESCSSKTTQRSGARSPTIYAVTATKWHWPPMASRRSKWARSPSELVLLDVMLPKLDGFEVLRRLRQTSGVPIVMLTARTDEIDRVVGLEIGADDYVTKPFSTREPAGAGEGQPAPPPSCCGKSFARDQTTDATDPVVAARSLTIDASTTRVLHHEEEIALKPKEFDLLLHLARHPGQVFPADQLVELVWGYDALGDTRTVRVHVRSLREKLEMGALGRKFIPIPKKRRKPRAWLDVKKATANNLRGVDVSFPLGVFCAVTGVCPVRANRRCSIEMLVQGPQPKSAISQAVPPAPSAFVKGLWAPR